MKKNEISLDVWYTEIKDDKDEAICFQGSIDSISKGKKIMLYLHKQGKQEIRMYSHYDGPSIEINITTF